MGDRKEKKVLVVPTLGLNLEGITTVIYNYVSAMNREGICFHFLTYGELNPVLRERFGCLGSFVFVSDRKQSTAAYVKDYVRLLRGGAYDVVHIHGNSGTMAIEAVLAKLCGVRKVFVHTHSTKTDHPAVNAVLKYPMMLFADRRIACSRGSGKWLYGNWKHTVLNNAIDLSRFPYDSRVREACRAEFGIQEEFLVGHIGHFSTPKNHFYLIDIFEAFHRLRSDSRLLLVSDGPDFEAVVEKVNRLQLQDAVIFAGRRSDVERLYQAFDAFVLPSRWEGMPLVLLEAQTAGLPVLASDRITKDVHCADRFWFLSIEEPAEVWAEKLLEVADAAFDRTEDSAGLLRDRGFDICREAERLRTLYLA